MRCSMRASSSGRGIVRRKKSKKEELRVKKEEAEGGFLSSGRVRWGLFRLATQAPEQVAGHDVGDHSKQHQEHRHPKNPTVMHSLPARTMRMISVMLVHGN